MQIPCSPFHALRLKSAVGFLESARHLQLRAVTLRPRAISSGGSSVAFLPLPFARARPLYHVLQALLVPPTREDIWGSLYTSSRTQMSDSALETGRMPSTRLSPREQRVLCAYRRRTHSKYNPDYSFLFGSAEM